MRRLILLAVLLGFLCLPVLAATYYIATAAGGGDNSHNGLYPTDEGGSNGPWLTLTYANSHVTAGDTVQIRGGTYQESTNWSHNGTADNRITITNYNGEAVVIDGGYTLPGGSVYYFLVTVSGDYVTLSNITIKRSSGSLLAISGDYSYAINVIGNGSRETGMVAVGNYNLFDGCSMTDNGNGYGINGQGTWGSAICTVGTNTTIQNCISHDNRGEGFNGYSGSNNAIIQDNIAYDNGSGGIYVDSSTGTIVRRNLLYCSVGARYGPTTGISIGGETGAPSHLTIVNNLCFANWINLVSDSNVTTADNWMIAYNTFVNTQKTAGDIAAGYNMGVYFRPQLVNFVNSIFKNNIIVEEASNQVPINTSLTNSHAGFTFSYNCWSETVIAAAQGTGDVVGDPKLAKTGPTTPGNLTANYFKILSDSPAIGKGIYDASILTDYFGTTRKTGTSPNGPDMGGYEYITGGGPPPIYYVDSSITDTYVGSATPDFTTYNHLTFETTGGSDWVYKTIADLNACTFSPDDFIYFRRGQTWRGQSLVVPSSGSAGHPITFGAYGTGANPVFDPTVEYNDFTLDGISKVQSALYAYNASSQVSKDFTATPTEGNLLIAYGQGTNAATNASITGWTMATSTQRTTAGWNALFYKISGASESKTVTLNWTDSTATRILIMEWAGLTATPLDQVADVDTTGGNVTSRSSGTTATTTVANELCIACFGVDTVITAQSWSNSFTEEYGGNLVYLGSKIVSSTGAQETTLSWTTAVHCGGLIATFKALVGTGYVWKRTHESVHLPSQVWEDGERMIYSATRNGMVQGSFFAESGTNLVYVWCSDDGNPNTGHVIEYDTSFEASGGSGVGIRLNGKSYLIFDSIDIYRANSTGYNTDVDGTTNVIIRNCTVSFTGSRPILIGVDRLGNYKPNTADVTISNVISHDGLAVSFWIGGTRTILEDCEAYNSGADVEPRPKNYPGHPTHWPGGILIGLDAPDSIVRRNYVHDTYVGCAMLSEKGDGNIIERNFVVSSDMTDPNDGNGIRITTDNATVRYNIIITAFTDAITFESTPATPLIYNNTIISASDAKNSIECAGNPGVVVKNNIIIRGETIAPGELGKFINVSVAAEPGFVADYNCYYILSGTPSWKWMGTSYSTFANWQTASGQDAHGFYGNPLLINAGGTTAEDYKLASDSPCINAGVNVGLTEDYEGYPIFGLPSIGAYEYPLGDEDDDSVILKVIKNVLKHTIKKTIKK